MRRLVVTDPSGNIVATGPHHDDVPAEGGRYGFMALEGHTVHEVELPAQVTTLEHIQQLHTSHTVAVEGSTARLIERRSDSLE